jgi:hypothetical protein
MTEVGTHQLEHAIARCRVLLAAAAMLVVYIDFEAPLLARWIPFISGPFTMDPRLLSAMALFLTYSLVLYFGVDRWIPRAPRTSPLGRRPVRGRGRDRDGA